MAYGLHKVDVFNVLVVDLGGGTLDVSLLNKQGVIVHYILQCRVTEVTVQLQSGC